MAAEETKLSSSHRNNSIPARRWRRFGIVNNNSDCVKNKEISVVDHINHLKDTNIKLEKCLSSFEKDHRRSVQDDRDIQSSGRQLTEAPPIPVPQQMTPDQPLQIGCDVVVNIEQLGADPQPQEGLSELGLCPLSIEGPVGLEVSLSGGANPQISQPEHNSSWLGFVFDLTLGPNRSNPIWRLRLLAAFTFVTTMMVYVHYLPEILQRVHQTNRRVMLILISIGASIFISMVTLMISCIWRTTDPYLRSNWITGLSITNVCMLGGLFAMYLAAQREFLGH